MLKAKRNEINEQGKEKKPANEINEQENETNGPFVTVVNTTRDKRSGVLYKPRRLPDQHLAVSPKLSPRLSSSVVVTAASPRRARPRQEALLRRAAPPRHARIAVSRRRRARLCRHPPSPTRISPTRCPSPTQHPSPTRRPSTLLLGGGPRPSSSVAKLHSCSRYAVPPPPMPPLAYPLCGHRPACVCPDGRPGRARVGLADVNP
jgi:hypothetical protein